MIGQTIAHYKVTAKLGSGGMGVVYRATDTKLGRDVALKVLPEAFTQDAQRMQRFQREAQVLASLNHPHIAAIYGLEHHDNVQALAMELVEGATLAERIAQGAMPLDEALPIAKQIAEALEYAHEKGIIHRDLKPANVKLTADGKAKVLDFGLAKALAEETSQPDVMNSPTLSLAATKAGIILGTAAYMSPEQARGRAVDRRTDVWAFGCVLYEMLTGQHAFPGEDVSETLAHVITKPVTMESLPASIPRRIRELLARCLEKDLKRRLQAIGEARFALEEAIANPQAGHTELPAGLAAAAAAQPGWKRALPWTAAGLFFVAFVLSVWRPWQAPPSAKFPVRMSVEIGADASVYTALGAGAVLSPDGRRLAFVNSAGERHLYVRSLDQLKATLLAGTERARDPFFSPDGEWLAFFADGKLKKVSVQGGAVVTLCDAPDSRGGSWGEDDRIVFAASNRAALSWVSAAGGAPQELTKLDTATHEITHRWPQVLRGGKVLLYTAHSAGGNFDNAGIVVESLETKERRIVQRGGSYAQYLPSGHLMYMNQGTLFAAPFDLDRLALTGQPAPAVEGVTTNTGNGGAQYSFSNTGVFLYTPGSASSRGWQIFWLQEKGAPAPLRGTDGPYYNPRFSPDGTRLAVEFFDRQADVHVYDWKRDTMTRITFSADYDGRPVWTPNGRWIAFISVRDGGVEQIYWTRSDGTGDAQRLTESKNIQRPYSWHPNGKLLAFQEQNPQTNWDVMVLPMEGDDKTGWKPGKPIAFAATPFWESTPAFSPDGRWLAYASNESGAFEVYVRPFPAAEGKWQVSASGGVHPIWSKNGRELFFRSDNKIMVANYTVTGNSFQPDKPRLWSDVQLLDMGANRNFDLHPDGKRFAIMKSTETQIEEKRDKVNLIENFFDELRRLAPPTKK